MELGVLQKKYNLSREAASRLLKVSVRTVDRYIKAKKLSSVVVDGRIWLDKDNLEVFWRDRDRVDIELSTSDLSIEKCVDNVDNVEVLEHDMSTPMSTKRKKLKSEDGEVYEKLYSEMKVELVEKQERLEIANYRIGQLESQIRQSIPMLKYHQENYENQKAKEEIVVKLGESTDIIKTLNLRLKQLAFNKRIFLSILLVILALQPIWLIFYLKLD